MLNPQDEHAEAAPVEPQKPVETEGRDGLAVRELENGVTVVDVPHFQEADEIRKAIIHMMDQGKRNILVNLTSVPSMGTSGLRVLTSVKIRADVSGSTYGVICPNPNLHNLLTLAGLDGMFTIYPSEQEALLRSA